MVSINCLTNEVDTTPDRIQALEIEIEKEEKDFRSVRRKLKDEKRTVTPVRPSDVIELNVSGEMIATTRQTLTKIPQSILSILFNGRWENKLSVDDHRNIRLDFNPILFRHLLQQLQTLDSKNSIKILPPSQRSLVQPFEKMLRKLHLQHLFSSEIKQIITLNVGGQIITNRRTTLTAVSNSISETIVSPSSFNNGTDVFLDYDPKIFQHLIDLLRSRLFTRISSSGLRSNEERNSFQKMLIDLNIPRK